jgi:hypothetical protein
MPSFRNFANGRPSCPKCGIGMVDGFGLDPERKTFECLQCGHVEKPGANVHKPQSEAR